MRESACKCLSEIFRTVVRRDEDADKRVISTLGALFLPKDNGTLDQLKKEYIGE